EQGGGVGGGQYLGGVVRRAALYKYAAIVEQRRRVADAGAEQPGTDREFVSYRIIDLGGIRRSAGAGPANYDDSAVWEARRSVMAPRDHRVRAALDRLGRRV